MTGTWRTLRIILRTSWAMIFLIPLALTALTWVVADSISRTYEDDNARSSYSGFTGQAPATVLLQGRGYNLDTVGGIFAQQMAVVVLTFFLLYAAWIGVHLTRSLEDKGYFDVITSGTVSRLAPTGAGALAAATACALTGIGAGAACLAHGFGAAGSFRYCAIIVLTMTVFAMLGTLCAQLFRHAAEATGLALVVVIVVYLIRGWIDFENWDATWTTPASWLAESRPFGDDPRLWPFLACLGLTVMLGGLTLLAANRRDLGGGLLPARGGRAQARPSLCTPSGLVVRLTWHTTSMVLVIGLLLTFVLGSFADQMSAAGSLDAQLVFLLQLSAEIAALVGVAVAGVLAAEERHGRTGLLLSASIGRWTWSLHGSTVALASSLLTLIAFGASTGLGVWLSTGQPDQVGEAIAGALSYAPAVVWLVALALLLCLIRPGLNVIVWAFVGWAIIVTLPSQLLDLSYTARHLSPIEWMGQVPESPWQAGTALAVSILSALALTVGVLWFRRRDLIAG